MIAAENVNKSGTEIKLQQIKLSLMLGLERAYEIFTSSVTTIHTTQAQEPRRNDVDIFICRFVAIGMHERCRSRPGMQNEGFMNEV